MVKNMASTQHPNVALVQSVYDAFRDQDIDAALAPMADDIEWTEPAGSVFGGTYHSPATVREHIFEPCLQEFEAFTVEPDRFIDAEDTVVALGAFGATTPEGERIDSPFAHVWELADGEVVRFTNYTDTALWQ